MAFIAAECFALNIQIALNTSDNTQYTVSIIVNILALILYWLHTFLAFTIISLPISSTKIPWANTLSQNNYLKEGFKILLIIQDSFIPYLRQTYSGHLAYYLIQIAILAFFILKEPKYFNNRISALSRFSSIAILSFTITCTFRLVFISQLLEIIIYFPIVTYTLMKLFQKLDNRRKAKILAKFEEK